MTSDLPDADASAAAEAARWSGCAAAWTRWADPTEAMSARFDGPLADAVGATAGDRVLDLACGAGEPAFTLAARVGATGAVTATDFAREMVAATAMRAREKGLLAPDGPVTVERADMTALPYGDASFDRVTCRFGVMFVPGVPQALAGVRRVLRPGGRAAFMVWGPLVENTLFDVVRGACDAVLGAGWAGPVHSAFRFDAADDGPETLESLMRAAGFAAVGATALRFDPVVKEVPDVPPAWRPVLDRTLGARADDMEAEEKAAIVAEIDRRLAAVRTAEGLALKLHVRIVTGDA